MIDGSGDIGVSLDRGGATVADNRRIHRLYKIVSGSNPYAATQVHVDESDGSRDTSGSYDVTAAQKLLYEVNGVTTVAPDTIVEATPNPAGVGFYFTAPAGSSCSPLPQMYKRVVGVDFAGEKYRYRVVSVDANGCETVSGPYCADGETCSEDEDLVYYCIDGVCWAVYDGVVPPTYDAGPFASPELCSAGCPPEPGGTMVGGCCVGDVLNATLHLALSGGNGTVNLVWNSTVWVSASTVLPCGVTVIFQFTTSCTLTWSTDGGETFVGSPAGVKDCGPPFSWAVTGIALGGGCGTLTGTLS